VSRRIKVEIGKQVTQSLVVHVQLNGLNVLSLLSINIKVYLCFAFQNCSEVGVIFKSRKEQIVVNSGLSVFQQRNLNTH
jgi:hypothetical protein